MPNLKAVASGMVPVKLLNESGTELLAKYSPSLTVKQLRDRIANDWHRDPSLVVIKTQMGPTMPYMEDWVIGRVAIKFTLAAEVRAPATPVILTREAVAAIPGGAAHNESGVFVKFAPGIMLNERQLRPQFGEFGAIERVDLVPDKNIAFIIFKLPAAARAAVEAFQDKGPHGSSTRTWNKSIIVVSLRRNTDIAALPVHADDSNDDEAFIETKHEATSFTNSKAYEVNPYAQNGIFIRMKKFRSLSKQRLERLFQDYGCKRVELVPHKFLAYVFFETPEALEVALGAMRDGTVSHPDIEEFNPRRPAPFDLAPHVVAAASGGAFGGAAGAAAPPSVLNVPARSLTTPAVTNNADYEPGIFIQFKKMMTEDNIRALFEKYGPIERVDRIQATNIGFVIFSEWSGQEAAMRAYAAGYIYHDDIDYIDEKDPARATRTPAGRKEQTTVHYDPIPQDVIGEVFLRGLQPGTCKEDIVLAFKPYGAIKEVNFRQKGSVHQATVMFREVKHAKAAIKAGQIWVRGTLVPIVQSTRIVPPLSSAALAAPAPAAAPVPPVCAPRVPLAAAVMPTELKCPACTFHNPLTATECEMCESALPPPPPAPAAVPSEEEMRARIAAAKAAALPKQHQQPKTRSIDCQTPRRARITLSAECIVCMERLSIVAFPCGHIMCEACAEELDGCVYNCTGPMEPRIKLFVDDDSISQSWDDCDD